MKWPIWWFWEIEITPHIEKRMSQRHFNELELRTMLQYAIGYENDFISGRYKIQTTNRNKIWEIIVEPDFDENVLVIVTAYKLEEN
jgi:hypothetical protein